MASLKPIQENDMKCIGNKKKKTHSPQQRSLTKDHLQVSMA